MDNLSKRYDRFYAVDGSQSHFSDLSIPGWPRNRYEAIVAAGGRGQVLLDVGCGDGFLLYQFRTAFKELVGLEFSSARLQQAEKNLSGLPFRAVPGSSECMSEVRSESVDQIISADTIEHIPDVYAAASEMFRVLKPGGRLVINTPNVAFAKKRLLLLAGRFPSTSQPNEGLGSDILFDGGHLHYFTFRSLSQLLVRTGFSVERCMGYGRLGKFHDIYPPLLSVGVQLIATRVAAVK
jgi:SAM-dependent methyltransferase